MSVSFASKNHATITWVGSGFLFLFKSCDSSITRKGERQSMRKRRTLSQDETITNEATFLFSKVSLIVMFWTIHLEQSLQWLHTACASQFVSLQIAIEICKNQIACLKVGSDCELVKPAILVRMCWGKKMNKSNRDLDFCSDLTLDSFVTQGKLHNLLYMIPYLLCGIIWFIPTLLICWINPSSCRIPPHSKLADAFLWCHLTCPLVIWTSCELGLAPED